MSKDQLFIWKGSLGGSVSWVAQSLGISKVGQTVLPRLMEFQIWYQLAGSMTLLEGGLRKETVASAGLDVRNFSFSLYPTGAFQAATLLLEPRGSESE